MVLSDLSTEEKKVGFNFNLEEFFFKYRLPLTLLLIGMILVGFGVFLTKGGLHPQSAKIEVLESASEPQNVNLELVVEIAGAVEKPGVYKFTPGVRVEDALIAAGGVSSDADRVWMERSLNRALKLSDGQKIYIPKVGESIKSSTGSTSSIGGGGETVGSLININTANQKELELLQGIGPVYAQNIIEHRPYSTPEELLSKGVLKKNVYEKMKDQVTVY